MDNETFLRAECMTRERQERALQAAESWHLRGELPTEPGLRAQLAEWFLALAVWLDPQLPPVALKEARQG